MSWVEWVILICWALGAVNALTVMLFVDAVEIDDPDDDEIEVWWIILMVIVWPLLALITIWEMCEAMLRRDGL